MDMTLFIGTAGWSIARAHADAFGSGASALERYATRFDAVEVNSSFHRSHRPATWARWASVVPADFRFSVKLPKTVTHERKLLQCADLLTRFSDEVGELGAKLGVLLVQLPPKLAFDPAVTKDFFGLLQSMTAVSVVCEPRHPTWFEPHADTLVAALGIGRVAADPACMPEAAQPGGCQDIAYWRLHGSPTMYRSAYGEARLAVYADAILRQMQASGPPRSSHVRTMSSPSATLDKSRVPDGIDSAPYFIEFVASSWMTSARDVADAWLPRIAAVNTFSRMCAP